MRREGAEEDCFESISAECPGELRDHAIVEDQGDEQNLTSKLIDLARERPLVAAGAVAAAATVVIKNPRIMMAVITGLFAGRAAQPPTTKRRR